MNILLKATAIAACAVAMASCAGEKQGNTENPAMNFDKPEGVYVISDNDGDNFRLCLKPKGPDGVVTAFGSGTLEVDGKTYNGRWSRFDKDPYITFELFNGDKVTLQFPSGPAEIAQFVFCDDGRLSYNETMLANSKESEMIAVVRTDDYSATDPRRAITIEDFVDGVFMAPGHMSYVVGYSEENLQKKGFSKIPGELTDTYTKGGITIKYTEDFDAGGEGSKVVEITFPKVRDARLFLRDIEQLGYTKEDPDGCDLKVSLPFGSTTVTLLDKTVKITEQHDPPVMMGFNPLFD